MAGHLLFEMMCGYELTTLSPSNSDMANVNSEAQVEVSGLLYYKILLTQSITLLKISYDRF